MDKKLTMHDIKRQLVDIVEYLGLHRSTEENYANSLRIDVKISGKAMCGSRYDKDHKEMDVSDLVLRFQTFCYSNYKAIYCYIPEPVRSFMYPDVNALRKGICGDAYNYMDKGWKQTACHDSCWRSGFDMDRFEIDTMTIEKIQLQKANIEDTEYKDSTDIREAVFADKVTIISDFKCPDTSDSIVFYTSVMQEFRKYNKSFDLTIANTDPDTFNDETFLAVPQHDGSIKMFHKVDSEEKKNIITVTIGDLSEDFLDSIIPNCRIHFFSDFCFTEGEYLSRLTQDVQEGCEVRIVNFEKN